MLQRSPGYTEGSPGYLSVLGSAEEFSVCTNTPTVGTPARQDIQYKAGPKDGDLEQSCKKIHLVIESTGIVAEDIPDVEV